ncbi:MAG: ABC transporter permease subunit, partial [Lachnospiraceae bacterium]|nr:ABC transporter permease subunit [Lachnospiraceae bacterium]
FADAFGMSTLSIATFKGFFATEVGTVHSLGSGMFAALIAVCILSKEEEGHTGEFLLSLPVSRTSVVAAKGLCVAVMLVVFTLFCSLLYWVGILIVGDEMPVAGFLEFMGKQCLMDLEIGAVCFAVSSLSWKNRTGLGLGIAVLFYFYDIIGRVVPDLKDALFIGPYSFANASEILSGKETEPAAMITSLAVTAVCTVFAFLCYNKRDIAS